MAEARILPTLAPGSSPLPAAAGIDCLTDAGTRPSLHSTSCSLLSRSSFHATSISRAAMCARCATAANLEADNPIDPDGHLSASVALTFPFISPSLTTFVPAGAGDGANFSPSPTLLPPTSVPLLEAYSPVIIHPSVTDTNAAITSPRGARTICTSVDTTIAMGVPTARVEGQF